MSDLVRLDPIETLATPSKADLLRARHAISKFPELQGLFDDAAAEQWNLDRLAGALEDVCNILGQGIGGETARYLAEEFAARDKTKTLLVSSETGLAVAQISSDAIYQPAPVAREGTDKLANPLPRIRPDIEAAIIQHHNNLGEERGVTLRLQERARSSELQKAEGDARLRISTRTGRKNLAAQLREELPTLLQDHRGATGRLLSLCRLNEEVPSTHNLALELTLFAHTSMLVADVLANNFRHDAYGSAREQIRAGWARVLARAIARQAQRRSPARSGIEEPLTPGLLIAEPNVIAAVRHVDKFPVLGAPSAILNGKSYLVFGADYRLDSYEAEARWSVDASIDVSVYLDPDSLYSLIFTNVDDPGTSVEVIP